MLAAIVLVGFVAAVLVLARAWGSSPRAPRTCCSNHQWPPDDLTSGQRDNPA